MEQEDNLLLDSKILDDKGNFDMDNKRLAILSEPVNNNDATKKVYVNKIEKNEKKSEYTSCKT